MQARRFCFALGFLVTACQGPGTPVPVGGGSVAALVGKWEGTYSSDQTSRVGSIVFELKPGRDTAFGDVLMIPANAEAPPSAPPAVVDPGRRAPRLLRISFVRCTSDNVSGWLEKYPDPDTGEQIVTVFRGVLKGNQIAGTFFSDLQLSGRRYSGKWSVKRRAAH